MNLKEFFEKNRIDVVEFSVVTGISLASLYRYMRGFKPRFKTAVQIEKFTNGQIKVEDWKKTDDKSNPS